MPFLTSYTIQIQDEPSDRLQISGEIFEHLGFGRTPYFHTIISPTAFRRIVPLLADAYDEDSLVPIKVTTESQTPLSTSHKIGLEDLRGVDVINLARITPELAGKIKGVMGAGCYSEVNVNGPVLVPTYKGIERLHADPDFAHLRAVLFMGPVPKAPKVLLSHYIVLDGSMIVDIDNPGAVAQTINVHLPDFGHASTDHAGAELSARH